MSISKQTQKQQTRYQLKFAISAKKEWDKLDPPIQKQFTEKLKKRLHQPEVSGDKLHGMSGCYKIKLRASGYRLVYEVLHDTVIVLVLAVGKRERNQIYTLAQQRLRPLQ